MKRKILVIVLSILLVTLIVLTIISPKFKTNKNTNETNRDFMLDDNPKPNSKGENTIIYVGLKEDEDTENFSLATIKVNKSVSKEDQAKTIISEISNIIGYQIDINSLEIDENKIKIDIAKTGAPFDLEASYIEDTSTNKIYLPTSNSIAKAVFDSISKSLTTYFGNSTEIYFSSDSQNITVESVSIDMTKPY